MRTRSALIVVVWGACSALCVAAVTYLGAASPERSPWLLAGTAAAVVGALGGIATARWRGQKGGSLLMGLLFAVLLAIAYGMWRR